MRTNTPIWSAFLPVTRDMGLIRAEMPTLVEEYTRLHASEGIQYSRRDITTHANEAFNALTPLSMVMTRRLFVPTDSEWVVFLQNGLRGSDPFITMSRLASRLGVCAMRVSVSEEVGDWPAVIWEVYEGSSYQHRRAIAAANDGGRWVFHDSGTPFEFEEVDARSRKKIRDRFTREMIVNYLQQFGIRALDDSFFRVLPGCPAVLLERTTPRRDRSA